MLEDAKTHMMTLQAMMAAGTRKAADFLTAQGWERFVSPMIHNLQVLQSGKDTSTAH